MANRLPLSWEVRTLCLMVACRSYCCYLTEHDDEHESVVCSKLYILIVLLLLRMVLPIGMELQAKKKISLFSCTFRHHALYIVHPP